jgi:hypothetical protein
MFRDQRERVFCFERQLALAGGPAALGWLFRLRRVFSQCGIVERASKDHRKHNAGYAFSSAKFLRMCRPSVWLFSGWNWVANTLSNAIIEQNGPP